MCACNWLYIWQNTPKTSEHSLMKSQNRIIRCTLTTDTVWGLSWYKTALDNTKMGVHFKYWAKNCFGGGWVQTSSEHQQFRPQLLLNIFQSKQHVATFILHTSKVFCKCKQHLQQLAVALPVALIFLLCNLKLTSVERVHSENLLNYFDFLMSGVAIRHFSLLPITFNLSSQN